MAHFRPKGHIALKATLERAGPLLVKGWTGYEVEPEIWLTDNHPVIQEERERFIANRIAEVSSTKWGNRWIDAVGRWFEAQLGPVQRAFLMAFQDEANTLAEQLGDEKKAWDAILNREAGRALLHQAKIRHDPRPGASVPWTEGDPASAPMIEADDTLEAIMVDRKTLVGYQEAADAHFKPVNRSRLAAQARWREAVVWLRQEFYAGRFACSYIGEDGAQVSLAPRVFGTDVGDELFRSGEFEGHELLVPEAAFDAELRNLEVKEKTGAEAITSEQSEPPQPFKPDPADFNPIQLSQWTTPMAAAWIGTRDIEAVREQWNDWRQQCTVPRKDWDGSWYEQNCRPASLLFPAYPDASGEHVLLWPVLRQALRDGTLPAAGTDIGTGIPVEIPAVHWKALDDFPKMPDMEPNFRFPGSKPEEGYDDVTVHRDDLLRIWPVEVQPDAGASTPEAPALTQRRATPALDAAVKAILALRQENMPIDSVKAKQRDNLIQARAAEMGLDKPSTRTILRALALVPPEGG